MAEGFDYREVAKHRHVVNQYDQHVRAIRFRKAIYRAVKKGLMKRVKSPPGRAIYVPVPRADGKEG